MSEEVETPAQPSSAVIMPAKSEDKLEIEKEEQERAGMDNKEDKKDEKKGSEEDSGGKLEDGGDSKKDTTDEAGAAAEKEDSEKDKKKFKIPNVQIKTPKVPGFLRSKSKERKKDNGKGEEEDKSEEGAVKGAEGGETAEKPASEGEDTASSEPKSSKFNVKEMLDKVPKMPKISKPGFMKKKKDEEGGGGSEDDTKEEDQEKEDKKDEKEEEKDAKEENNEDKDKKEDEQKKDDETEEKKSSLLDNLKSRANQVPGLFKKREKTGSVESGDKEESKELLEDRKDEGEKDEEAEKKGASAAAEGEKPEEAGGGKKNGLMQSIKTAASQVPAMFKKKDSLKTSSATDKDVEAGESQELLDKKSNNEDEADNDVDSNKKGKDDKATTKINIEDDEKKDPAETASQGSEKKDQPEKENEKSSPPKDWDRVKAASSQYVNRFQELEPQRKIAAVAIFSGIILLILIIAIAAATCPSGWTNEIRYLDDGKHVETHTSCGTVIGLVEGEDQLSFYGIPYAVSLKKEDRWSQSKPMTNLEDCHEDKFRAHQPEAVKKCWSKNSASVGSMDEDCLTLNIYTSSVIYNELMPVVVYIRGDDIPESVKPSSDLAKNMSVVFVEVNYRTGVLGFLSMDVLSRAAYPHTSGNYGLGDVISALKWIRLNIQHFGGHPARITVLGTGIGATIVTSLTASHKARGLYDQIWVTNGAGAFSNRTLEQASNDNEVILGKLACGSDKLQCLKDASAKDLMDAAPYEWQETSQAELPQIGENGQHSWIVVDKNILSHNPIDYWKKHKLSNKNSIVFGATAQAEVNEDNYNSMKWDDNNEFEEHIEGKLGSFNVSLPQKALDLYKDEEDNWHKYATMLSDIRTVCPVLNLAEISSANFVAKVYAYVATQPRTGVLGDIADVTSDVAAILGVYNPANEEEEEFVENMQDLFYRYVKTSELPQGDKDLVQGMYVVDSEISTQTDYPKCEFWKEADDIVPLYANLD